MSKHDLNYARFLYKILIIDQDLKTLKLIARNIGHVELGQRNAVSK